jgi:hypothetical protein
MKSEKSPISIGRCIRASCILKKALEFNSSSLKSTEFPSLSSAMIVLRTALRVFAGMAAKALSVDWLKMRGFDGQSCVGLALPASTS